MRLTLAAVLTVSSLWMLTAGAMAGDYHTGSTLKCYQCHIMHQNKSHLYGDDSGDDFNPGGAFTSYDRLLRQADTAAVCLECHDGEDTIDVYGDTAQGGQPLHRSAGRFNESVTDAYAPFASLYGHNLKNGPETPPGGSGSYDLDCASCHDPHGNDYYRNLRNLGAGGITYAMVTNDTSKDVFELKPYPANSVADAYDAVNISYNLPDGAVHAMEGFCASCHPSVHNLSKVSGDWLKHPTIGFGKAYTAGTVSPLKTIGGRPVAGGTGNLIAGQVSCVTCHKAHGSTHSFGLIYDNRTTPDIEDSGPEQNVGLTCKHCHNKGLTTTE
ncbi:MAG: cytochrome c3 family protein [Armatimonadota bacterium]|nr:cytochrome c3 family protein [Armatimonadota bacterium]